MVLIWLGAALVLVGVLFLTGQTIWRGPLSQARRSRVAGVTLEPPTPGGGFGLKATWPGFLLITLGAVLLLAGLPFYN